MSDAVELTLEQLQQQILEEFWTSGSNSGSIVRDCKHGTTFFEDDESAGDWEDGELEELREKAKAAPEKYVASATVEFTSQYGQEWCWQCQKCLTEAIKHQRFIWSNRDTIASFLNARLASQQSNAEDDLKRNAIKINFDTPISQDRIRRKASRLFKL